MKILLNSYGTCDRPGLSLLEMVDAVAVAVLVECKNLAIVGDKEKEQST